LERNKWQPRLNWSPCFDLHPPNLASLPHKCDMGNGTCTSAWSIVDTWYLNMMYGISQITKVFASTLLAFNNN
jgi:hypothetical protein